MNNSSLSQRSQKCWLSGTIPWGESPRKECFLLLLQTQSGTIQLSHSFSFFFPPSLFLLLLWTDLWTPHYYNSKLFLVLSLQLNFPLEQKNSMPFSLNVEQIFHTHTSLAPTKLSLSPSPASVHQECYCRAAAIFIPISLKLIHILFSSLLSLPPLAGNSLSLSAFSLHCLSESNKVMPLFKEPEPGWNTQPQGEGRRRGPV